MRNIDSAGAIGQKPEPVAAEREPGYREHTDVQVSVINHAGRKQVLPGATEAMRTVTGQEFSSFLGQAWSQTERSQQARAAAEAMVAVALVQPSLEAIQSDPFRSELFHGGFGEEVFMGRLHALLAERIVKRADLPIVRAVYERIMQRGAGLADGTDRMDRHG